VSTIDEARAAKEKTFSVFSSLAAVVGVGITRIDSGYGVKVNLAQPPGPHVGLPDTVDGVPIRIEVVGNLRKR